MNPINMNGYTRISKPAARKRYNAGETIYMDGCKMVPGNPWGTTFAMSNSDTTVKNDPSATFDKRVMYFEHYNANHEQGYYAAFYIKP